MESGTSTQSGSSQPSRWLIGIILLFLLAVAAYWYQASQGSRDAIKYAFAIDHPFDDPVVFYDGKGLRYELTSFDRRLLKVFVPQEDLNTPKYLLVEDGELDYLGYVKKDQTFIPLQLFQIHNDRPGKPESPVTDCKTYLELAATADSILVLVDGKYILRGDKVGPNLYVINFCETTREHQFQVLGPYNNSLLASKGQAPMTYSMIGMGGPTGKDGSFRYQIRGSGDTIRIKAQSGLNPAMYGATGQGPAPALYSTDQGKKSAVTKVIFSMPRSMQSPWVYLNDKRISNFTLNANRNQVVFWVKQNGQPVNVRVGDTNCECQGSGLALNPVLELAGYCECRDIQVFVNLDPGLDRYRSKIKIYIDGQLSDLRVPPAGQPLVFNVRKTNRDQFVEIKLLMPDDTGNTGLFDLCSFTIPTEVTTVNLSPSCHCAQCPPNIKVSG